MATLKRTRPFDLLSKLLADDNLTQKAYLNALAAALEFGARLAVGFIVTPFLVAGLGDSLYGVWRTLGGLTGYLSAASGRPSQALKWTIANQQNSTDYEEKRRNIGSALVVWLLFLPLLTALGGVLVWFAPIWIKDIPSELYWLVRVTAVLLVAQLIATTLTYLPQSVLEGENLGYKRMGMSAMLTFAGAGLTILALKLNTGLIGVAVANLIIVLATGLFYLFVARSQIHWFGYARPTRTAVRQFFGLSGWFLIWRLVMQLMTTSDLVILGMFASTDLVTTYALTKYAPETLINFVAIVVFGITPGLGGIIGAGDRPRAARVRSEIMLLTWLITTAAGAAILLWNEAFLQLWVGAERYAGATPNLLILLSIAQFVLIRNDANIIDLTLDLSQKVLLGLVSTTISVLMAGALVHFFDAGILGLVVGLMAGRAILSIVYPIMIGRFLGVSFWSQCVGALRPILVSLLLIGLIVGWGHKAVRTLALAQNWFGFLLAAGLTTVAAALIAFYGGLNTAQQRTMWMRVERIWR
ncbi:MAG: hypothetical protein R2911_02690 [Caldilineaceae bacterium]